MKEIEINMIKHMTKEEFMKKASETSDWAPGWDAIDQEFARLYPDQKPMLLVFPDTSCSIHIWS